MFSLSLSVCVCVCVCLCVCVSVCVCVCVCVERNRLVEVNECFNLTAVQKLKTKGLLTE